MDRIPSFNKDHTKIKPGFSLSGVNNGISTFDLRFIKPNGGKYLSYPAIHSIEHMMATVLRNGKQKSNIVYFGPMGCRTGFYLLTINLDENTVKKMVSDAAKICLELNGVPGCAEAECGNYLEHDISEAKKELTKYIKETL